LGSFSALEIVAEGSSVSGFFRTICVCLITFARPTVLQRLLKVIAVPVLNLFAALLEWLGRSTNDQFSANFAALARK
jgi:hypothetical protein